MRSRKAEIWILGVQASLPMLLVIPVGVIGFILQLQDFFLLLVASLGFLGLAGQVLLFRRLFLVQKRLMAGDYKFCTNCGHELGEHGEAGECPGCTKPFVISKVQQSWGAFIGDRSSYYASIVLAKTPGVLRSWLLQPRRNASLQDKSGKGRVVRGQMSEAVRSMRWALIPVITPAFILVFMLYAEPISNRFLLSSLAAMGLSVVVGLALIYRSARSLGCRLRAGDGKFCLRCGYNLNDLGESGICPECGESFEVSKVQQAWSRAMEVY